MKETTVESSRSKKISQHYDTIVLKGHSQLMHMRIKYHFLADLHFARPSREIESEKRIRNTQNKLGRVELVTSPNRDYRL